ncbi:MAG: hypothetical protein ACREHG_05490, partial [Candidatus Saccharimonadales bacterium]
MSKKVRLAVLTGCVALFVVVTPYLVLYSLGYRINFAKATVSTTGGIYVRAWPSPNTVTIDGKSGSPTNFFANDSFLQNLTPGIHQVSVTKPGYFDYQKSLPVVGSRVTKLESVVLFKQQPMFTRISGKTMWFSLSPDGNTVLEKTGATATTVSFSVFTLSNAQPRTFSIASRQSAVSDVQWSSDSNEATIKLGNAYFLINLAASQLAPQAQPQLTGVGQVAFDADTPHTLLYLKSGGLFMAGETAALVKNVLAYQAANSHITYLSNDGLVYDLNTSTGQTAAISNIPAPLPRNATYNITLFRGAVFLQENAGLLKLNHLTGAFEPFAPTITQTSVSSDGQRMLSWNAHEVFFSRLDPDNQTTVS